MQIAHRQRKTAFASQLHTNRDGTQAQTWKDVGVVSLAGHVCLALVRDGVEGRPGCKQRTAVTVRVRSFSRALTLQNILMSISSMAGFAILHFKFSSFEHLRNH